jgi:Winged helix DNA-binding domain
MKPDVIALRLRNQRLAGSEFRRPEEIVSWLGAVQSQDYPAAKWGVALRSAALTDAALDDAFDEGRILRTHILRPTWHFVTPADIRWMLSISAPRVHAQNAHYYRKLELDPRTLSKSRQAIERALRGGKQLTRPELGGVLERAGIVASGHRLAYIVIHEELDRVLTSGPRRGKQFTYMLLDERVPGTKSVEPEAALAQLTQRYFTSHGPATVRDFVWWSGLTVRQAKSGLEMLEGKIEKEVMRDVTYWMVPSKAPAAAKPSPLYLLPNYDEYLIAYKDRGNVVPLPTTADAPRNQDIYAHVLVVDGKVGGTWRRALTAAAADLTLRPVEPLGPAHVRALSAAAARHGTFLGVKSCKAVCA